MADIQAIPKAMGPPTGVLADNGYANGDNVQTLEEAHIKVRVATGTGGRWRHDFRPIREETAAKEPQAAWLRRMQETLATPEARARYRLRQQTVEPVFGILKERLGSRRFHLRSLPKVVLRRHARTPARDGKDPIIRSHVVADLGSSAPRGTGLPRIEAPRLRGRPR
jgi:hypothetical protein